MVLVDKKSSTGWMGKLFLAMFLVVVCCAGALLFVWFWNGRQEMQVRVKTAPQSRYRDNRSKRAGLITVWFYHRLLRVRPTR